MANRRPQKDLVDQLADFVAHNKGVPVFLGVGMALLSLILGLFPALQEANGFVGWLTRSDLLLHLGVIVGLLGILLGDAL